MNTGNDSGNSIRRQSKNTMMRIGLLSDTHSHWDNRYIQYFSECNEIWHAGDIGSEEVLEQLKQLKPVRAVYGNCDGQIIRSKISKNLRFTIEGVDIWLTHIGGYPGKYASEVIPEIFNNPPKLFICGHSHILKVINDPKLRLLHINPGAAGIYGFHTVRTIVRFTLEKGTIKDLEVIEMGGKNAILE